LFSEGNGEDAAIYLFYWPILLFSDLIFFFFFNYLKSKLLCSAFSFVIHRLGVVVHGCFATAGAVF
jgi:hypothetical protein